MLKTDDDVSGFAMIDKDCQFNSEGQVVADFYISPEKQRCGHGRHLAKYVFTMSPGQWEVCVRSGNKEGYKFWKSVISSFTNDEYKVRNQSGYDGQGFTFNSE